MSPSLRTWSPLPLRIMLGIGFIHHGWHNVIMADERQAFTWMLSEIGIGQPVAMLWIISILSFGGGVALITGSFVRIACLALALNVPAILFIIHARSGFDFVKLTAITAQGPQYGMPGYEVSLLYLAGLMALFISGAGSISVDGRRAASATATGGTAQRDRPQRSAHPRVEPARFIANPAHHLIGTTVTAGPLLAYEPVGEHARGR